MEKQKLKSSKQFLYNNRIIIKGYYIITSNSKKIILVKTMNQSTLKSNSQYTRKTLTGSLEFLVEKDIDSLTHLILKHFSQIRIDKAQDISLCNIQVHLKKLLYFIAQKNTSFVVKQNNNSIAGICLNLDIKDLINLFETFINISLFENLGLFNPKIKNFVYKLADSKRGDYLYNILTIFVQKDCYYSKKGEYICRGISFCKVIGWKKILYNSNDPFLFLKLGGKLKEIISQKETSTQDTLNTGNQESNITDNLQRLQEKGKKYHNQLQLKKTPYDSSRLYLMQISMDDVLFKSQSQNEIKVNIQQKLENKDNKNMNENVSILGHKIYLIPRL